MTLTLGIIPAHIIHERQCVNATVHDDVSKLNFQEKKVNANEEVLGLWREYS